MYIKYEDNNGQFFDYEVNEQDLRKLYVRLLCSELKRKMGDMYSEDGAYQMANYIVYNLEIDSELFEYFQDDVEFEYRQEAYEWWNDGDDYM